MAQSSQQSVDYAARLDRFAELLSLGISIPAIRERMGLKQALAYKMLDDLRRRLGWQAI
jgi:hypothetical protein